MFTDFTGYSTDESFASVSNKLICASGFLADVHVSYIMLLFFALTKTAPSGITIECSTLSVLSDLRCFGLVE